MTTLVTGATGNVGRIVVDHLVAAGRPVRALTRNPAGARLPPGVDVVRGDLAQPETLASVLDGVERMYLFPVPETASAVVDLARDEGVRRIVVLSSSSVDDSIDDDAEGNYGHARNRPVERAVENAGLEWTHLRAGEFMLNTLDWAHSVRTDGVVRGLHGNFPGAPIHEADVAAVAAASLLEDHHVGQKYFLTGPERITPVEQVRLIGAAIGRDVRFEELTLDQARELWQSQGMPEEVLEYVLWSPGGDEGDGGALPDEVVNEMVSVSHTVEQVTGRPARTYAHWVADHADDFR